MAAADGWLVSSLVSVFEHFGSATFVPEGGFTLNNRAACFTNAPNDAEPGKLPVHTLSPILVTAGDEVRTLATPGADGQVQSLLQVLTGHAGSGDWESAMAAPRWRSDSGRLLIERSHPGREALEDPRPPGRGSRRRRRHLRLDDQRRPGRRAAVRAVGLAAIDLQRRRLRPPRAARRRCFPWPEEG